MTNVHDLKDMGVGCKKEKEKNLSDEIKTENVANLEKDADIHGEETWGLLHGQDLESPLPLSPGIPVVSSEPTAHVGDHSTYVLAPGYLP